jgi:hypothetical protein
VNQHRSAMSDLAFFGLLLVSLVLSASGHIVVGDEETMLRVTQNLLTGRGLVVSQEILAVPSQKYPIFLPAHLETIPTTSAVAGRNGQTYSKYGIGQSLVVIPLYLLGALLAQVTGTLPVVDGARQAVAMLNPLALAGCSWLMVRFGRVLGYRTSTARWIALAAIFTSMAWPYVKTFYGQPSVALLMLAVVYAAYRWRCEPRRRWTWVLALAYGVAILFRATEVIILPALSLYLAWAIPADRRWEGLVPLGVAVAAALGLDIVYNWLRFGSLLSTGYTEVAWTTPPLLGLYGLLFSPGKGVLIYTPMLILGLGAWIVFAQQRRAEAWLIAGLWLSYLVLYAPYDFWTGGFNWGPRFLLPVVPLSFLPLGTWLEAEKSRLTWALFEVFFVIGLAIQTPAILVDHSRYLYQQFAETDEPQAYTETIQHIDRSPVTQQWRVALELLRAYTQSKTWQTAARSLQGMDAPGVPNGRALLQAEFLRRNSPDVWWLHGRLLDPSRPAPFVVVLPWLALGLVSTLALLKL